MREEHESGFPGVGKDSSPSSSSFIKSYLQGPREDAIEKYRKYELQRPVDCDGVEELYVKASTTGCGLACFSRGKPRPYEYKRDASANRDGFLTSKESDESWENREEIPWAEYTMQITLGSNWFRDEFSSRGGLRPMQDLHEYVRQGRIRQQLRWDTKDCQYEFVNLDDNVIYRGLLDPALNPAPYCNDSAFGLADAESDIYDALDEAHNPLIMIPCLSNAKDGSGLAEFSSVWFYPRGGWKWEQGKEQEVTVGYHWPLEPWMMRSREHADSNKAND